MEMKQCSKCKQWKRISEFYKSCIYKQKQYLSSWCKNCHNEQTKNYNIKFGDLISERKKKYYQTMKASGYYDRNRKRINKASRDWQIKTMLSWLPYLPENCKCEICNKELKLFGKKANTRVNFDHRNNNLPIKMHPSTWLRSRKPNPKNIAIWKSCNFGILCMKCNTTIPTNNRKEWLNRIIKYVGDFK